MLANGEAQYVFFVNRGVLRIQQERFGDAVADFNRAVTLRPELYQTYLNLAEAHARQGKLADAIGQLGKAIKRSPGRAALYRTRARLYLRQNPPERKAALDDLEKAIARDPAGAPAAELAADHKERGLLLAQDERHEEAVRAFDAALKVLPSYPVALRLRAESLMKLGRYQETVTSLDQYPQRAVLFLDGYLKNKEPVGEAFRRRALAQGKLGNHLAALGDYSRALGHRPELGDACFSRLAVPGERFARDGPA